MRDRVRAAPPVSVYSLLPQPVLNGMLSVARTTPRGDIVEVGVYRGGSAWHLAQVAADKEVALHLFDTFTGMPHAEDIDKHRVGDFSDTSLAAVQDLVPNARCYPGTFPDTLPGHIGGFSFVHCDVDQYLSTLSVIEHCWPRIIPGGVLWFDDVELAGAMRAIREGIDPELLLPAPEGRLYARKP